MNFTLQDTEYVLHYTFDPNTVITHVDGEKWALYSARVTVVLVTDETCEDYGKVTMDATVRGTRLTKKGQPDKRTLGYNSIPLGRWADPFDRDDSALTEYGKVEARLMAAALQTTIYRDNEIAWPESIMVEQAINGWKERWKR